MKILPIIFSLALFCSAFLSFAVQPILGKMMLPMVGGAPSGWIVAMAFFQIALLGGYGVSYVLGKLSPWKHAVGLLLIYVAGCFFLPPHLPEISDNSPELSLMVIKALAQTILVPFLALTATTAALQRVFSATNHPTANDPYYLFVASNIGSFAGLLIYPFFLEPTFGLKQQALFWQGLFIVAIGLIFIACVLAWRARSPVIVLDNDHSVEPVSQKQLLRWLLLAFVPCSLSMGVTNLITTDIGGMPLFWVAPLGLYLLTFVLAFSRKQWVSTKQLNFLHMIAAFFVILSLAFGRENQTGFDLFVFVFLVSLLLGVFFIIAYAFHQNLANSRPQTQHLTLYYFIIALGGGLAGLLHAFVIPFVLKDVIEFPAMVLLSLLFLNTKDSGIKYNLVLRCSFAIALASLVMIFLLKHYKVEQDYNTPFCILFFISIIFVTPRPRYLFALGVIALVFSVSTHYQGNVITRERNFFGQYAVYDLPSDDMTARILVHGTTIHGVEVLHASKKEDRFSYGYYSRGNPIQDILTLTHAKTIGVIGLGSGQMACYNPALTVDFYEIDKDIQHTAQTDFSYLKECPPRDIFIGDGRRMLEKQDRHYDMIMLDAFSSDGIPLHLVTREALAIYRSKLTQNGMLIFHVSNRYLKLAPPIAAVAAAENLHSYSKLFVPKEKHMIKMSSLWVTISMNSKQDKQLEKMGWKRIEPSANAPWTDDQSSLFQAF